MKNEHIRIDDRPPSKGQLKHIEKSIDKLGLIMGEHAPLEAGGEFTLPIVCGCGETGEFDDYTDWLKHLYDVARLEYKEYKEWEKEHGEEWGREHANDVPSQA